MNYEIQTLSHDGTEYMFGCFHIDPDEDEAVQNEGYYSRFTLFVVFNDSQVIAHHDKYEIARQMPDGGRTFVLDSLDAVRGLVVP